MCNAVVDENGNVTQFSVSGASNGWFRINASYIGEDSIVTVNQQIE
jgi:hypothetical protein